MNKTSRKALVVGGSSGIGHGIAVALAKRGDIAVSIAGRNAARGAEIVQELTALSPNQTHSFRSVDGFDLENSVKELTSSGQKPDLLVMTQGMATTQGYTPTVDGIDQKLQLHYFSRFYLFRLLAPHLQQNHGRVLTVLSADVHRKYQKYDSDFELKHHYSVRNAADAAGYYTDAGFEALAEKYPNVIAAHAAPGFVNTDWGTEFPWYLKGIVRLIQPLGKSPEKCGEDLVNGWLGLPHAHAGKNFFLLDPSGKVIENGTKHTREERDVIWEKTLEILPDL